MQRPMSLILSVAILAATAGTALAQADAQQAYKEAKTASQTDPKNAEVFVLLGKAHYQLGELDEATAAWKRTLALAPEEPFAKRMLDVLRGQETDGDTRIKLIDAMIREKLCSSASRECARLLSDKALSDAQRARVMTLQAELFVRMKSPAGAQETIRELLVLYPSQADPVQTTLLLGQAKLQAGGESTAEGLALLKKVVADHPDTPAAATARFELINFDLKQGVDAARAGALAKWLAAIPPTRWPPKHARP